MNDLEQTVEKSFNDAMLNPTWARWREVSVVAGCASVRMAADGQHFLAAQLEGVSEEAKRQMKAMEVSA